MPFLREQLVADGVTAFAKIVWTKAVLDIITASTVTDVLSVIAGGAGYVVGETFEIVGGTAIFAARGEVLEVDSTGAVTAARIVSSGAYSALPTLSSSTTTNASAAGDDNLVVALDGQAPLWVLDDSSYVDDLTDFEWIAHSTKAELPPSIGMKTFATGSKVLLQMQSEYNALASFEGQPGRSPGQAIATFVGQGACLYCTDSDPVLMLSQSERRIVVVHADPPRYQLGYLGLFVPYVDDPERWPYPGMVAGTNTPTGNKTINDNLDDGGQGDVRSGLSSIVHPWIDSDGDTTDGSCYYIRDNLSPSWLEVDGSSSSGHIYVWPAQADSTNATLAPEILTRPTDPFTLTVGAINDDDWFEESGAGANTPGVAPFGPFGRSVLPVPCQLVKSAANQLEALGFVDGVYAVHGRGLTEEDVIENLAGVRFRVFPDVGGAPLAKWCAIAEV